jgi:serine/threonine-protein kinase
LRAAHTGTIVSDAPSPSALSRLLDEALELPPDERKAWIDALAPPFEDLKPRLRALLARADEVRSHDFLGTLARFEVEENDLEASPPGPKRAPGDIVGPYRLIEPLGVGGMGAVWLAERTDGFVDRPVALKLPHAERLATGLAERMARERKILAALAHPNIARLYDAGLTAEGQPYLAIEHVDGRRIDTYCNERSLGVAQRITLFLQVATAVAHAHAKLIVHRDLKPANILVTADGQVRLLDFGIAKILEEGAAGESELTRFSGRALTLEYASPEQITNEPITIASDVYSLGVVLYELLTGARPYRLRRQTRGALEEAILQDDPQPPTLVAASPEVRRALRGDLDTIILKALRKHPEDRYATVNAFVDDLERHRSGLPVSARPDGAWYRLRKFIGRNRLSVAAAATVLAAIITGSVLVAWQARVALAEKERAEEVKEFIASVFREADPYEGEGSALTARDLLRQATTRIDETFAGRPQLQVELLNIVGFSLSNLEDYEAADALTARTVALANRALGESHPLTLKSRVVRLSVARFRGKTDELRNELATLLQAEREGGAFDAHDRVTLLEFDAHLALDEGRHADAERAAGRAAELAARTLGPKDPLTAEVIGVQALTYQYNKKPELALRAAEQSYQMMLELHRGNAKHPLVTDAQFVYGRALADMGRSAEAIERLDAVIASFTALRGADSTAAGFATHFLSQAQFDVGDVREALRNAERSLAVLGQHTEPKSFTIGAARAHLGRMLLAARRGREAADELEAASEILRGAIGAEHDTTVAVRANRALALAFAGASREAMAALEAIRASRPDVTDSVLLSPAHALGVARRLTGNVTGGLELQLAALEALAPGPKAPFARMRILAEIGAAQAGLGRFDDSEKTLGEALALFEKWQTSMSPYHADALLALGRARMGGANHAGAAPLIERADAFWRNFAPESRWAGESALWLGRCYGALGRGTEAREHLERARRILSHSPFPADRARL